jgi:hypothetical protein
MASEKIEINIFLTRAQYLELKPLRELGLNMSSISRIAITKYHDSTLENFEQAGPLQRVQLYLDLETNKLLQSLADRVGTNRSETLRNLLSRYLHDHMNLIKQLF